MRDVACYVHSDCVCDSGVSCVHVSMPQSTV